MQGLLNSKQNVRSLTATPVATFGIGRSGAKNAGLFAAAMLAGADPKVRKALDAFRKKQTAAVPQRPF